MAEQVHLYLKANGSDVQGESTVTSLGRENSIECMDLEHEVTSARDAASGLAVGRRQYSPLKIRKRIDKASPLIMKAMTKNEAIEGVLPCLDFAHLHARPGDGTQNSYAEWAAMLTAVKKRLGAKALNRLRIHLSGIAYGPQGDKNHPTQA